MSGNQEVTYTLDFCVDRQGRRRKTRAFFNSQSSDAEAAIGPIPRIARLMALAIRFEGLVHEGTIRDYARLAILGRVTRARMSQITQLLHLAPDIQEQLLFLPVLPGLNERNLRPVVSRIDWSEQRVLFQRLTVPQ